MSVWAIVLAAGSGSRFGGGIPKQYLTLGDRRVIDWSLAAAHAACDGVVLVTSPGRLDDPELVADVIVAGGAERSDSVRAGLAAVPKDCDVVVVHDGARPLASVELFAAVIGAIRDGADGAIPGVAVVDTIKRVAGAVVVETLAREELIAVQTPQAFAVGALRHAHETGGDATDDAALVEQMGARVVVVPGELRNRKLTHASDLPDFELLLTDS